MERYSSHFTHSLVHWLWSEELMKVTKSTRGQRFSANDASQLQQDFGHSRAPSVTKKPPEKNPTRPNSGRHELCYFQIKRKSEETENTKLLWKWVCSTGDKIQIPDWLFAWECFDYCLWFQSNVIYCLEKHLNKTAPRHSSAREAWRASPLSRLCWLAELQQMCINIVIKLEKKVFCSGIHHCPDRLQELPNKICLSANRFQTFIVM